MSIHWSFFDLPRFLNNSVHPPPLLQLIAIQNIFWKYSNDFRRKLEGFIAAILL
jgi:hypothetical protein